jgi:putrescine aminotransferase
MNDTPYNIHEINRLYRNHVSPDLARLLKFGGPGSLEISASGSLVTDDQDREYLDLAGGYGVFNLGHSHPKIVQAVQRQLGKMALSSRVLLNPQTALLAHELAQICPGKLQYSFFCNSGTEAVEAALKFARLHTGRQRFVSCENSYHGKTFGSLSVTGRSKYRLPFEPLISEVEFVPFGDFEALETAINDQTAAFIVEPIQGEGGIQVAPDGYLQHARAVCDRTGCLLIADEVQSGLGRTGKWFGVDHWGVEPDLMTLAKALGGGVLPMGAVVGTADIWKSFKGQPLLHTSTFGGNPLACVAARTTLQVLREEGLLEKAAVTGQRIKQRLKEYAEHFVGLIREVRGLGLMIGVEFYDEAYAGMLISELVRARILAVYTLNQPSVIRLEPALNISSEQVEMFLSCFQSACDAISRKFALPVVTS